MRKIVPGASSLRPALPGGQLTSTVALARIERALLHLEGHRRPTISVA